MRWAARTAVALLIVAALIVAAGLFGPNLARERVAQAARRALGRDVTIGDLRLLPSWPPVLTARDVSAAGLGTVARIRARIAASPLLAGRVVVEQITLVRPDLSLAPDANGRLSLLPAKPPAATPSAPQSSGTPHSMPAPPVRVVIEDGKLSWHDKRIGPAVTAAVSGTIDGSAYDLTLHGRVPAGTPVPTLTGATVSAHVVSGQPVHAVVDASINGQPVQATIDSGTPGALVSGGKLPITVAATAGGATLRATGSIADLPALSGIDLAVSLQAANERRLAALFAWPHAAAGKLSLEAHLDGGPRLFTLHGLTLQSPQGDMAGDLTLALGPHPNLRGTLRSQRLDLDAAAAALAPPAPTAPRLAPRLAPAPAQPPPTAARTLIPNRPLPFAALRRADADITFRAATLRFAGVDYRDLAGHLALQDGRLALTPFAAVLPGGAHLDAALRLDGSATPPAASLVLHAPAVAVAPLLAALHLPDLASGTGKLDADLHGSGATPHALAASLDGTASLHLSGGAIDGGILGLLLHGAHLPVPLAAGRVAVSCAAVGFVATDGVLAMAPLVADTDRVRIEGGGTVDLGHETLALHLLPLLRTGPGLVIPVQVSGPWRTPKVAVGAGPVASFPADSAACPAAPLPAKAAGSGRKPPKPIDILRGLLR